MSPEHITALIVGGFTILGGVATQIIARILSRPDRRYERAFDRAEKQWEAQFRLIEATKGSGKTHAIKPLRYWLLCELSMDAIGPPGIITPEFIRHWKRERHEAQLIKWLRDADVLERSLHAHELSRPSDEHKNTSS